MADGTPSYLEEIQLLEYPLLSGTEGPQDYLHHGGLEAGHHKLIITWIWEMNP